MPPPMPSPPRRTSLATVLDQLELGFGRGIAGPLFAVLDAMAPRVARDASWEPDTHRGGSFVRDAPLWRRSVFLLKMLGTHGLGRRAAIAALRAQLADRDPPRPTEEGPELLFLGDLLAVDGLGSGTLSPGLRARLARADRLVINLEGVIGDTTHAIAPLLTPRGLVQMVQWNRGRGSSSWSSCLGAGDLRALLDGLPPVVFSVANNHTFDDGPAGFAATLAAIEAMGAAAAGVVDAQRDGGVLATVGEGKVGFVAVGFGSNHPAGSEGRTLSFTDVPYQLPIERIAREIARLRAGGASYVVALLHWGYEHEHLPRPDLVACVEQLWDLGVQAVVGHHPHLVQPCAGSGRRLAAFSLGDFVGGDRTVFSRFGLALSVRLPPAGVDAIPAVRCIPLVQTPHHAAAHRTSLLEEASADDRALWDAVHQHKVGELSHHRGPAGASRPSSRRRSRSAAP